MTNLEVFLDYVKKEELTLGIKVLLILMFCDVLIGSFRAIKTKRDKRGNKQCIDSMKGTIGLLKKGAVLTMLVVAHCIDLLFNSNFIFEATCFYAIFLELLSLKENYQALGIECSPVLEQAIELVENKSKITTAEKEKTKELSNLTEEKKEIMNNEDN